MIGKKNGTSLMIDWSENVSDPPYPPLSIKIPRRRSTRSTNQTGQLDRLEAGSITYKKVLRHRGCNCSAGLQATFSGSLMFIAFGEYDALEEICFHLRRLYIYANWRQTWYTMCNVRTLGVCHWVPSLPNVYNDVANTSLTRFFTPLGADHLLLSFDTFEGLYFYGDLRNI